MHGHRRLLVGLCVLFLSVGWHTIQVPAQSTAPAAQSGAQIVDAIRFREIGPTRAGRPLRGVRGGRKQPAHLLRRDGDRRAVENREQRHQLHARLRRPARLRDSARSRSRRAVRTSSTSAPARRTTRAPPTTATASTSPWTPARPGRRPAFPTPGRIGRIVVHPKNPDIVFVAASGRLYSENPDRGVYRSTDGGKTWTKTLDHKVDGRAIGAIDIAMDPANPKVLYAATYDKVRRPWTFGEGGPGSAIFKSTDGGATWRAADHRPSDRNARPHRPLHRAQRSEDGLRGRRKRELADGCRPRSGASVWRRASATARSATSCIDPTTPARRGGRWRRPRRRPHRDSPATAPAPAPAPRRAPRRRRRQPQGRGRDAAAAGTGGDPPYYYGQIRVDPKNKEHVYLLSVGVTHTTDGGKTWSSPFGFGGDNHALWINPNDSNHMILGHDHGMGVTFDAGRTWLSPDNKPLAQFYAIGYDMEQPYNVYGGLQDNGSVARPEHDEGRRQHSVRGLVSRRRRRRLLQRRRSDRLALAVQREPVRRDPAHGSDRPASHARSATRGRRGRMRCAGTGRRRSSSRRTTPRWSITPPTCCCARATAATRGPRSART